MGTGRLLIAAILFLMPVSPSMAHEGHRQNLSDADMAEMQTQMDSSVETHMEGADHSPAMVMRQDHSGGDLAMPSQDQAAAASPVVSADQALNDARERNRVTSIGDFLGRLHPVAVHFPMALLLMAAFAELVLLVRPTAALRPTVHFLVGTGSAGAVIAALLGWFAAGWRSSDRSETLALHRWTGTGIAVAGLLALWLAGRPRSGRTGLRIVLAVLAFALVVQGYAGGEMAFGPNHLGLR